MMKIDIDENIWINERFIVKVMIKEDGEECEAIVKMVDGENIVVYKGDYWACKLHIRNMFEAKDNEWW